MARRKQTTPIPLEQHPFRLPENWAWVRLGEIGVWKSGSTPSREKSEFYINGTINWLKTGELNDGFIYQTEEKVTEQAVEKTNLNLNKIGSVLIAMYGATIGRIGIAKIPLTTNQACCACDCNDLIFNKYLFYFLLKAREYFLSIAFGSGQPNISKEKITETLIPLPPLAEQHRIVEKIEQLFTQLDQAAEKLTAVIDGFELRKTAILHKAFTGKLVPQNLTDEPAQTLLQRIQQEKQTCSGSLKKQKQYAPMKQNEIPFRLPENWQWVRLGEIVSILNGDRGKNYPAKSTLSKTGIPFISALNLNGITIVEDENLLCLTEEQYKKLGNGKLQKNDMVLCIRGSLGKHAKYPFEKGAIASSLVILRSLTNEPVISEYIMKYLDTPLFSNEIKKYDNGTAQPNLAAKDLALFLVPLPPLSEQKRIVEKIEQLLKPSIQAKKQAEDALQKIALIKKAILAQAFRGEL